MKFSGLSLIVTSLVTLLPAISTESNTNDIKIRTSGALNTADFQLYYEQNGHVISAFHDIPLFANENKTLYNMIVEIPRWTNAKNEINKETALNPIKQDVKNGKARFVANVFPFNGYIWNYGAFPQTWEDPGFISPYTNQKGDNDPIDVIEIGSKIATVGEIKKVKILGIVGLLDQNETDWKVVVIDSTDKLSEKMNDIGDVDHYMPGLLNHTSTFLKNYKLPSGGARNTIAFNDQAQDKKFATERVLETYEHWKLLINGTTPNTEIEKVNLSVDHSPFKVDPSNSTVKNAPTNKTVSAAKVPSAVDVWYYINLNNTNTTF